MCKYVRQTAKEEEGRGTWLAVCYVRRVVHSEYFMPWHICDIYLGIGVVVHERKAADDEGRPGDQQD